MRLIFVIFYCITSFSTKGQNSLSVSVPMIYSNVTVKNNWSPPTAIHRINQFSGTAIGSGININYSFRPVFIFKNRLKHFTMNIGVGYFSQRFDVIRFFNYNSPYYLVYSTDHYSYKCWQGSVGLVYIHALGKKHFFKGDVMYSMQQSFKQEYTPKALNSPTQINKLNIDFARTITLVLGVQRKLGGEVFVGLNLFLPYVWWRNDKIFGDNPSTFSSPSFSLGGSVNVIYRFKNKTSTNL